MPGGQSAGGTVRLPSMRASYTGRSLLVRPAGTRYEAILTHARVNPRGKLTHPELAPPKRPELPKKAPNSLKIRAAARSHWSSAHHTAHFSAKIPPTFSHEGDVADRMLEKADAANPRKFSAQLRKLPTYSYLVPVAGVVPYVPNILADAATR